MKEWIETIILYKRFQNQNGIQNEKGFAWQIQHISVELLNSMQLVFEQIIHPLEHFVLTLKDSLESLDSEKNNKQIE